MKTLRSVMLVLMIFVGIGLFYNGLDGIASFKKPVDLYAEDTNVTELGRLDNVEVDVYAILDCFASETTTTKRNGSVTGKKVDYYYILPAFDGDDTYYIGLKASSKEHNDYEKIADLTWDWLEGKTSDYGNVTAHVNGCLKKMDKELYKYMKEWFEEAEWFDSDADIEKYVLNVYLEPVNFGTSRIVFLVCIGIMVVGVIVLILGFRSDGKHKKQVKEQTHVVINGVSYPKASFEHINRCILNREKIFAVQELRDLTGLDLEEAQKVIDNWNQYYLV